MPSTITHAYFSMDLYDRFTKQKKELLEQYKGQLKTFAQGPDVFFFYNIFSIKRGQKIRDFGSYMHQNQTQAFFVNLITKIKKNKLDKNPEVIAFLYGFIAHYVLDMTAHPFIIYRSGIYNIKDKSTYKYFGGHEMMESYIDAYFIKIRAKMKPSHFKSHSFCFPKTTISKELTNLISDVALETFNKKDIGYKYISSVKQMKTFYHYFRNDRTGIKKSIYKMIQVLPIGIKVEAMSYNIKLNNNEYYLNLDKEYWYHPLNKKDVHNYSFIEIYSIALSKTIELINEVDKVLQGKKDLKYLDELFPNLSYLTGYDCKLGKGKYFMF